MELAAGETVGKEDQQLSDIDSIRELKAMQNKEFRKDHRNIFLNAGSVFADLNTGVTFDLANGLFSVNLGLEDPLGLPEKRTFFNASLFYRISPVSGLYVQYYGIDRKKSFSIGSDIIFLRDTIPSGTMSMAYFDTRVISAGYMLSILQDPDAFLGAFFNIYLMQLETGVRSDIGNINSKVGLIAPLPNLGLNGMFKLADWLYLDWTVGFFSLHTADFSGSLYDLNATLNFRPAKWLGVGLSYQEFNVRVEFPEKGINTTVDYNFRGPKLGVTFIF